MTDEDKRKNTRWSGLPDNSYEALLFDNLEKSRISVERLERSSKRLEIATWILVSLTLVLAFLTIRLLS